MLDLFSTLFYSSTSVTSAETEASSRPTEVAFEDEDGFVVYNHAEKADGADEFDIVENPEILEMSDDMLSIAEKETTSTTAPPCPKAIKRREEMTMAKAKLRARLHLESVMFAHPVSGEDVRTAKVTRGSGRSAVPTSNAVRRINISTNGSQRSKKSSGKSNDRKTHRASDLFESI